MLKILLPLIFLAKISLAQEAPDYLAIAARLVSSGELVKAQEQLDKLEEAKKDSQKYFTVLGLLRLYQEDFEAAEKSFLRALNYENEEDRYLNVYLAQSFYGKKDYKSCLSYLSNVEDLVASVASIRVIQIKSLWNVAELEKAWMSLNQAIISFPSDFRFHRLKIDYLIDRALYSGAVDYTLALLKKSPVFTKDLSHTVMQLRAKAQLSMATELMEILRLSNVANIEWTLQLAYLYLEQNKLMSAAILFEELAIQDSSYADEAAEIYRRLGNWQRALSFNSKVSDQKEKFKQRLAIYIAMEDFKQAATLDEELKRSGLLESQELIYALGYVYFRLAEYDRMERLFQKITDNELFEKVTSLRKQAIECQKDICV